MMVRRWRISTPPPLQLSTSFSFAAGKNGFISFQQREDCSSQGIGEIETSQNSLFCSSSILKVNIVSVFCSYTPSWYLQSSSSLHPSTEQTPPQTLPPTPHYQCHLWQPLTGEVWGLWHSGHPPYKPLPFPTKKISALFSKNVLPSKVLFFSRFGQHPHPHPPLKLYVIDLHREGSIDASFDLPLV